MSAPALQIALLLLLLPACGTVGCGSGEKQAGSGAASAGVTAQRQDRRGPFRFFSPASVWNRRLAADAPLDRRSTRIVSAFDAVVARERRAHRGPNINTVAYSVPIYTVSANRPTVKVRLNAGSGSALQAAWDAVPLPTDARPATGSDGHLVVWQPSRDRLWEFWRLARGEHGWHASWGGAMQDVSASPGVYGPQAWPGASRLWGASASSLSILGGLITLEDLERGQINHALAIAAPDARSGVYSSPAERTDGTSLSRRSLPEGAHLRLDPDLDLAALHLPRLTLMVARAAQRYGILVRDNAPSGVASFFAQDPTPTGSDPYTGPGGYFEGTYPTNVLASFPWRHLELLRMALHRGRPGEEPQG